jgi:UDP-glucose 4-epimerase
MINLMLQNRQPIIYGDGEQKRSFSDVDDCIYSIDKLATDPNITSELVNIGPEDNFITINELFKKISNQLQFNQEPEYFEDRINEVKLANCSSDKAKKILNYEKKISLDESLDKMINYIKTKGKKNFEYNYNLEITNEKTPRTWVEKKF